MSWRERILMLFIPWRKAPPVPPGNTAEALNDVRRRQADIERRLVMLQAEVDNRRSRGDSG